MKKLIYQYFDGNLLPGIEEGIKAMKTYANAIGVEYIFEHNPKYFSGLGKYNPHFGQFKVLFDDKFKKYDKILFADTDVFPTDRVLNSKEDIFDSYDCDIGICTESFQPKWRKKNPNHHIGYNNDEKWAKLVEKHYGWKAPRNEEGLLKVYNSGVILYNIHNSNKIIKEIVDFNKYQKLVLRSGLSTFYTSDQCYIHAMICNPNLNVKEMDHKWNAFVHYIGKETPRPVNDMRTKDTNFVHIQLSGVDHFDRDELWRITNLEKKDWKL